MYNLYNLEPKFKAFLLAVNISAISLRNYLSDIRHFFGWLLSSGKYKENESIEDNIKAINSIVVEEYRNHHRTALPVKTINRRLSALRKFLQFCQKEGLITENPAKTVSNISSVIKKDKPKQQYLPGSKLDTVKPSNIINYPNSPVKIPAVVFISLFILFMTFFALTSRSLIKVSNIQTPINLPIPPSNNRYLAFNGKINDSMGNPITTKTDVIFKLYNSPNGDKALYSSFCLGESGAITPDVNGNVRVIIGSDCDGNPIPSKLFTENANLYLGISISADSEMKPRQHIPNVGYATNADSLQGFSIGEQSLSLPYINQEGNLLIAASNPGIRSLHESSNFTISSADTIAVQSAAMGDVILQATESGAIKLRTGGISDLATNFILNDRGNVGIGTLFPNYKLEVSGDIKIADGNKLVLASSSSDPAGTNGSMYYNSSLNKLRCYENGAWVNCFNQTEKNPIGGIYNSTIEQESTIKNLQEQINNLSSLLTSNYSLLTSNFTVREKIISPIIETGRIETKEIKAKNRDLILDLSNEFSTGSNSNYSSSENPPAGGSESRSETDKGPLAKLIIKGLEGKTAATIDATGNASFSGQLVADSMKINHDATIAGRLKAKEIESENVTQLEKKLDALQETTNTSTSEVNAVNKNTSEVKSEINEIQKLLAEIKNQPLPDPEYYQNLENNQQLATEQLTVSGKSNLFNLSVAGSSTIGSLLIENDSILSLAWDLKLSALSTIRLFDDAVVISKDGTIQTRGKIITEGGIKTNKIEIADKFLLDETSTISATLDARTAIAGNGAINANSSDVIIYNENVNKDSLIYLTPTTQTLDSLLTVSAKESCEDLNNVTIQQFSNEPTCKPYFKVALNKPVDYNLSFNWLILN